MSIIKRYVLWRGHDAGGTLPPVEVVAAIVNRRAHRDENDSDDSEVYVFVPPQWLGDWESGQKLAPAYQHIWRVKLDVLLPIPDQPRYTPYRPVELPPSACGPSTARRRPRS